MNIEIHKYNFLSSYKIGRNKKKTKNILMVNTTPMVKMGHTQPYNPEDPTLKPIPINFLCELRANIHIDSSQFLFFKSVNKKFIPDTLDVFLSLKKKNSFCGTVCCCVSPVLVFSRVLQ